ncbi:hypothetical protein ACFXTH_022657 [Malus domestica]
MAVGTSAVRDKGVAVVWWIGQIGGLGFGLQVPSVLGFSVSNTLEEYKNSPLESVDLGDTELWSSLVK